MKVLDFLAIVAKYNVPNSYYTVFEEGEPVCERLSGSDEYLAKVVAGKIPADTAAVAVYSEGSAKELIGYLTERGHTADAVVCAYTLFEQPGFVFIYSLK